MRYFIIAGEASGDLHAANLMRALKEHDAAADFCFLGGDLMQAQGGHMVKHYRDMAFMGVLNVILNLRKALRNMRQCREAIVRHAPDIVILVDYPGFNLRIAKFIKKHCHSKVYYYIAPKLWAWKSWRIRSIRRYVDRMFTIFPFETAYFAHLGYTVEYVGNPTVDAVQTWRTTHPDIKKSEQPTIALLAGSRRQEIRGCLPKMIQAAQAFDNYKIVVAGAPGIQPAFYRRLLPDNIAVSFDHTYDIVAKATAAIVNSGTATLETALIGTPQVVVYHVNGGFLATILRKLLIKIPYISLVNLVGEDEVVKELVAQDFTVKKMQTALQLLLHDADYRRRMTEGYRRIARTLGHAGTAERTAALITQDLLVNTGK